MSLSERYFRFSDRRESALYTMYCLGIRFSDEVTFLANPRDEARTGIAKGFPQYISRCFLMFLRSMSLVLDLMPPMMTSEEHAHGGRTDTSSVIADSRLACTIFCLPKRKKKLLHLRLQRHSYLGDPSDRLTFMRPNIRKTISCQPSSRILRPSTAAEFQAAGRSQRLATCSYVVPQE